MQLVYNVGDQLFHVFCSFLVYSQKLRLILFIPSWPLMIIHNYIFIHLEFILVQDEVELTDEFWNIDNCHPSNFVLSLFI